MVTRDKSDVVAIMYRQTAADLTIYYFVNRSNPSRRHHIEEVVKTIRSIVPNQKVKMPAMVILFLCLEACSRKIK